MSLRVEPYAFRSSHTGALVIWCWDGDAAHLDSLLADRFESVVDTGEVFPPGDHW